MTKRWSPVWPRSGMPGSVEAERVEDQRPDAPDATKPPEWKYVPADARCFTFWMKHKESGERRLVTHGGVWPACFVFDGRRWRHATRTVELLRRSQWRRGSEAEHMIAVMTPHIEAYCEWVRAGSPVPDGWELAP